MFIHYLNNLFVELAIFSTKSDNIFWIETEAEQFNAEEKCDTRK